MNSKVTSNETSNETSNVTSEVKSKIVSKASRLELIESSFLTSEEFGQGKYYKVLMITKTANSRCTSLSSGQFH